MTFYLDDHTTTQLTLNQRCYQVYKPNMDFKHDKYNIRGIAHARTNRKGNIFMQRKEKLFIYIGVGARDLYIDKAHMALDIFRFAEFFGKK